MEILEFCKELRKKTEIIVKISMTHADTNKRLKILSKADLIYAIKIKNKKAFKDEYYYRTFYKTSDSGINWLEKIRKELFVVGL